MPPVSDAPEPAVPRRAPADGTYTHTVVRGFWLGNDHYEVANYAQLLLTVCAKVAVLRPEAFTQKVLGMRGPKRVYCSRDKNEVFKPG